MYVIVRLLSCADVFIAYRVVQANRSSNLETEQGCTWKVLFNISVHRVSLFSILYKAMVVEPRVDR